MAITLSTGALLSVAKSYAASVSISAISNASQASITTGSAHSIVPGDYVEITSSWGLLNSRIARAYTGTTGSTLILEGIDTSDTTKYPAGSGATAATVRKITTWSQLSQVKGISASGGSQNFANITSITDTVERQIPTTKAAVNMTVDVFDDPERLRQLLAHMTAVHEGKQPKPWAMDDAPRAYIDSMLRAIVGFALPIQRLQGQWKLNQDHHAADRAGVHQALSASPQAKDQALAAHMQPTHQP